MVDLFSARGREALTEFLETQPLLIFDYDGTLAPIVRRPGGARERASTRRLLAKVVRRYRCSVLSGRARADLVRRFRGVPLQHLVGNHGMEWERPSPLAVRRSKKMAGWIAFARRELARTGVAGIVFEPKKFTFSVHYRGAPDRPKARAAILSVLRRIHGKRVIPGKCVFNILPPRTAGLCNDKGDAVLKIAALSGTPRVIYVGDDWTDETVFRLRGARAKGLRLFSIHIGGTKNSSGSAKSAARYRLPEQREIDRFLKIALRANRAVFRAKSVPSRRRRSRRSVRTSGR